MNSHQNIHNLYINISKYLNSNFDKYAGRLSEMLFFWKKYLVTEHFLEPAEQ
jgi:hypothetical protein